MENYFYVYIIYTENFDVYYKGFTQHPVNRLKEHNEGKSRFTSGKGPWKMVYLEQFRSKRESLIREKQLKRYNHDYIKELIKQPQNLIHVAE